MFRDTCYTLFQESDTTSQGVVAGGGRDVANRLSNCSAVSTANGKSATWAGIVPPHFSNITVLMTVSQSVLIHAAAGGVGIAAIRICKGIGAKVTLGFSRH